MNNRSKRLAVATQAAAASSGPGNSTRPIGAETGQIKHRYTTNQDFSGATPTHEIQKLGPKIVKEISDFKKKIGSRDFQRHAVELVEAMMKIRSFQLSVKEFLKKIGTTVVTTTAGDRHRDSNNKPKELPASKITDESIEYDY